MRNQKGYTLVELMVTMTLFIFTIAAASNMFVPLLGQFKQQSKLAETQIQGVSGLEILRRDLEMAGFGLPWVMPAGLTYQEASASTTSPIPPPNLYNDASNAPRAILSGNQVGGLGNSDYLVVKATSIAVNDAAPKWTYVIGTAVGGVVKGVARSWGSTAVEDLETGDRAIVVIPTRGVGGQRVLISDGNNFTASFNQDPFPSGFSPFGAGEVYLVYGVDPDTNLRMPFNRADYYIRKVAGTIIPPRCAQGTGILTKSVIRQADGDRGPGMALMDCVADLQVVFRLDTDNDGEIDNDTDDIALLSAGDVRNRLKEVRVYILSHEGQMDRTYKFDNFTPGACSTCVRVGEFGMGHDFDLSTISDYESFRWKVYTLAVKPKNLGG